MAGGFDARLRAAVSDIRKWRDHQMAAVERRGAGLPGRWYRCRVRRQPEAGACAHSDRYMVR